MIDRSWRWDKLFQEDKESREGLLHMADQRKKKTSRQKMIVDILWFILGAIIGLFSLIGLYVVAMNVL
ncbi:MAG: hypothetical protein MRJ96_13430 [Nitrospirales bacterium]|nr:hypothetical protein [Nitrospirales bacterium]